MSLPWQQVERFIHDHKKEIGWKGGPCVRLTLRSGQQFFIMRTIESNETMFAALVYVPEETIDEIPRFHFIVADPKEIQLFEAFEPEPRRPEHLKRLTFSVTKGERTDRFEKKPSS